MTKSERREKFKQWVKRRFEEEKQDLKNAVSQNTGATFGESSDNPNDTILVNENDLANFDTSKVTFDDKPTSTLTPKKNTYNFSDIELAERRTDLKEINSVNFRRKYGITKEMCRKSIGEL